MQRISGKFLREIGEFSVFFGENGQIKAKVFEFKQNIVKRNIRSMQFF